jgi:DNA-binding CsgD family transcriptional regulator/tetratricopeptide (TPR) repeat protein
MAAGLLERVEELAELGAAARAAADGRGVVALVHGEAGIGKTALVQALPSRLPAGTRLLVGWCDALATPRTLGPLKDVAPLLGGRVTTALATGERDAVMAALPEALARGPVTALVVEDAHWADEATVDALRFLSRRLHDLRVLLVLTYRDDELDGDHPLTDLLGDLGHAAGVVRLPLRRLSREAVSELVGDRPVDAAVVHRLTDGNPYLATELIASTGRDGVPPSVIDGVLARLRRLPPDAQEIVEHLAVFPRSQPGALIEALPVGSWSSISAAERRGLLTVGRGLVRFRHELTRRAVLDSLGGARRVELERTALRALEVIGTADLSQMVHHAVACGDNASLARYGPAAAREAVASGAHREAVRHYETVLAQEDLFDPAERADLWDEYAVELYTTALGSRIVAAGRRAVALRRTLGEPAPLARSLRWLSRFCWYAGERTAAEEAAAQARAAAEATDDEALLGLTLSNQAQLAMLADDQAQAVVLAERAVGIARRTHEPALLSHALTNLGTALFRQGGDGRPALEEAIAVALGVEDHEDACRGYANLGWALLDRYDLDAAEELVGAGITHAAQTEFLAFWQYLQAVGARVQLGRARWSQTRAALIRLSPEALPSWCVALGVRACLEARTGTGDPVAVVREGWALARRLGEPQRILPMAAAALEVAALTGTPPVLDAASVYREARRHGEAHLAAELGYRLGALGSPVEDAVILAAQAPRSPYALMAVGRWHDAATRWERLGWTYQRAEALANSPDPADGLAALELLDAMGAVSLARQVRRGLRERGITGVPRGPAPATRTDPAGLTARQRAVMRHLADGLTNAEIAARLTLSVRTVDSHVAAILAKLGAETRHQAAQRYRALTGEPARVPEPRADLGSRLDRSR